MADTGGHADAGADDAGGPLDVAVVGMSAAATTGMYDHAQLLAGALADRDIRCSLHWLVRSGGSLASSRAEVAAWADALRGELAASPPDAVLLHYASFAYAYRGVPAFLRPTLAALAGAGPIVAVLHELAYPWSMSGLRGKLWALTQRIALRRLMRECAAAAVTMERRERWLRSRRWLPSRPLVLAPVFSNLPAPAAGEQPQRGLLGLFGYGYEGVAVELVLDALGTLREHRDDARLVLLGSPGADSEVAAPWLAGASARDLREHVSFTGRLPAQELSDALAGCELLLCAASQGPTSNRGTLAGSLASGRPVVAIDGPRGWPAFATAGAIRVVEPTAAALAGALASLLDDEPARALLATRGIAFYDARMSLEHSAEVIGALLREHV